MITTTGGMEGKLCKDDVGNAKCVWGRKRFGGHHAIFVQACSAVRMQEVQETLDFSDFCKVQENPGNHGFLQSPGNPGFLQSPLPPPADVS